MSLTPKQKRDIENILRRLQSLLKENPEIIRLLELRLEVMGKIGGQRGENYFCLNRFRCRGNDDHVTRIIGHRIIQNPATSLRIRLSNGTIRGGQCDHFEPRMMIKQ